MIFQTVPRVSAMLLKIGSPIFVLYSLIGCAALIVVGPKRVLNVLERMKLSGRFGHVTLPDGPRLTLDFRSLIPLYEIYWLKCYEYLPGFSPQPGDTVVDVGAHAGIYSARCSTIVGQGGRVVAIEPHPVSYRMLEENVSANGFKNVVPVELALSSAEGSAQLYFSGGSTVGTLLKQPSPHHEVKTTTFDNLRKKLGLANVDVLKIDVEGAEVQVLSGAARALAEHAIGKLVVETHKAEYAAQIGEMLLRSGYKVEVVEVFSSIFALEVFPTVFAKLA